jgi:hypothetical protein
MQDSIRGTFLESVPPSAIELSDCFVLFRGIAVGFPEFQLLTNFSAIFFLTRFWGESQKLSCCLPCECQNGLTGFE